MTLKKYIYQIKEKVRKLKTFLKEHYEISSLKLI